MKRYKFTVIIVPQVAPSGNILPENTPFSCEFWADSIDMYNIGEQLFDFWKSRNLLGKAQDTWIYEWNINQL
ncbi:MAG TPA: hypothetical protein VN721_09995 [Flavipsychrobacter sp.]|nr:hypothetical protein [Flavipsychrobacter sp.]